MSERMTAADYRAKAEQAGGNKYGAEPVKVDGIRFDSKREARRWHILRLREMAGEIEDLQRQVVLVLHGKDDVLRTRTGKPMRITVDFAYVERATGVRIYEDAKGKPTRDYEVKRAVAAAEGRGDHGIMSAGPFDIIVMDPPGILRLILSPNRVATPVDIIRPCATTKSARWAWPTWPQSLACSSCGPIRQCCRALWR